MVSRTVTFQEWINAGYEEFSAHGPSNINVQSLSRKMNLSKSSFYHHFGDRESYIEFLLEKHIQTTQQFSSEVKQCRVFDPDFIDLMQKYKSAVFFQQQLRINSETPVFNKCYEQVTEAILKEVIDMWAKYMNVSGDIHLARKLYLMIITLFYERVRQSTFNAGWIRNMLGEVKLICRRVIETQSTGSPP